jgi:adenosylcobinamide-phosphate synthase
VTPAPLLNWGRAAMVTSAPLLGWVADRALGDPRSGHPVAGFGRLAGRLERRLWRDGRPAGAAYVAVLVGGPAAAAWVLQRRLAARPRALLLALVTWTALGSRSLGREGAAVADAVARGDLDAARRRLPALCGRDPSGLDGAELCRAATESVAENTADAVVGPLLWGALAGPAGVVAHRCVNTLDAMVGYRSPRYERFGWAAARLDDLVNWAPARVTALLATVCAPLVGGSARRALTVLRRDGGGHPSPNAGRCEAAFAGALGVRLGGANRYGDRVEVRGPLGDGPLPTPADLHRAVRLSTAVGAAAALLPSAAALLPSAGALLASGGGPLASAGALLASAGWRRPRSEPAPWQATTTQATTTQATTTRAGR